MKLVAPPRWLSLAAVAMALLVLSGLSAALMMTSQRGSFITSSAPAVGNQLDRFGPAPDFRLTDQLGRPVRAADLRGKIVVVNFIYTHCPDICPLLSTQMHQLQAQLHTMRLLGRQVQLLSITVDPARDTPEVLRSYASSFEADPDAWRFLHGTEAQTRAVVVDGFKLGVELMEAPHHETDQAGSNHSDHYEVAHSGRFVLIDPDWTIRAYYDSAVFDAAQILADIQRVAREPGR